MNLINGEKLLNKIDAYCKANCKYTEAEQDVMCRACMVDDIRDMIETEDVEQMSNFKKAKEIVKAYYRDADMGIFDSRNLAGDAMATIYEGEGLTIDICYYYSYFEVFGLSDEEFEELKRYYNSLEESEVEE